MASRKMNKTIYVAGKVYDLATTTAEEIKTDVQNRLDAHYGEDRIIFKINVWEQSKEVVINFFRSYNDWYKTDNKSIFCADADLFTGRGIDDLRCLICGQQFHLAILSTWGLMILLPAIKTRRKSSEYRE